jgi:hypothetical protein
VAVLAREMADESPTQSADVAADSQAFIKSLVDKFLAWKLPSTVRPDPCTIDMNYPYRDQMSGTNLLTADEATKMFEYIFTFDLYSNSALGWMIKYERNLSALEAMKRERDEFALQNAEMKFELEAKQRPLGEHVLELTQKLAAAEAILFNYRSDDDTWKKECETHRLIANNLDKRNTELRAEIERLSKVLVNDTVTFEQARELKARAEKAEADRSAFPWILLPQYGILATDIAELKAKFVELGADCKHVHKVDNETITGLKTELSEARKEIDRLGTEVMHLRPLDRYKPVTRR